MLEFGTPWCSHCQSAQLLIQQALQPEGRCSIKVEDVSVSRWRSYRVKLWPTLVFLRDGAEVAWRGGSAGVVQDIRQALSMLQDRQLNPTAQRLLPTPFVG